MSATPNITVNIDNNGRIYQIVATLLLCGALGMIAWALAQNGLLELAATALTMFLLQLTKLLVSNGLLSLPKGATQSEFAGTAGFVRTAIAEFQAWQSRSPIWRLVLLAIGYTLAFLVARWLITAALGVFSNIWIAGAAAAFVASLIIAPQLLVGVFRTLRAKTATPKTSSTETTSVPESSTTTN